MTTIRLHTLTFLVLYVALFGALIVKTNGLPYVMDNNESFSSLWHAESLFKYGIDASYGLADEAFSPHAGAHPYVHTHQGNFPRLFALAIYALGARSIESQIVITTFTVGLGAILLLYAFFARIAPPTFAFLATAVFMTDYVLFTQWHVVTYRVWYSFLLFFALYSIEQASDGRRRIWLAAVGVAFASLFYFELVFAAFAAMWCGLYALFRCIWRPALFVQIGLAQATGAVLALALVVAQGVSYLGVEDFRRDIYLTFAARNDFVDATSLLKEVGEFYETRRVIFWHNIQGREGFKGLMPFLRSFTAFDWSNHTPMLSFAVWIVALGWVLALMTSRLTMTARSKLSVGFVICTLTLSLLPLKRRLFDETFNTLSGELLSELGLRSAGALCVVSAALVGAYVIRKGTAQVLGEQRTANLSGVLLFLAAGALAYAVVYALSPGYIYTGYLARHAPFTVFLTDVVVAVSLYVMASAAASATATSLDQGHKPAFTAYAAYSFAGIALLLSSFVFVYWSLLQISYVRWLPPTHYSFLKKLSQPPYLGASFIVNNYAAPVAAYTGQWAYLDTLISQAYLVQKGNAAHLAGEKRYLWFADRDTNDGYRRPEYFVCMIPQGPYTVVNRLLRERGRALPELGCSQLALVRLAKEESPILKGFKLVDYDREGLETIGFDSWAIVKLEWGAPDKGTVLDWTIQPPKGFHVD